MRLAGFKDSLLGFGNDAQKRYFAVFGAVHADTQINFLVAGVGFESFVEAENGIVGSLSDNIKMDLDMRFSRGVKNVNYLA